MIVSVHQVLGAYKVLSINRRSVLRFAVICYFLLENCSRLRTGCV